MRHLIPFALLVAAPLAAQAPAPVVPPPSTAVKKAATTITAGDVAKRVGVIADDSMLGRDTPSPGLEMTAQYVADQFKAFGLKPGGENGTWFQRYEIIQAKFDPATSHVGFMAGGQHVHAAFTTDARYQFGSIPGKEVGGTAVVVGGRFDPKALEGKDLKGKVVVMVVDYSKGPPPPAYGQVVRAAFELEPVGIVVVSNRDSAGWAQRMAAPYRPRVQRGGSAGQPTLVEVNGASLGAVLQAGGVDVAQVRADTAAVVREVAGLRVMLDLQETVLKRTSAPNTIGILEGTDPKLKGEYVVYSAHMDHVGVTPGKPDSIYNGADDDASGTVGVVELARKRQAAGQRGFARSCSSRSAARKRGSGAATTSPSTRPCRSRTWWPTSTST